MYHLLLTIWVVPRILAIDTIEESENNSKNNWFSKCEPDLFDKMFYKTPGYTCCCIKFFPPMLF